MKVFNFFSHIFAIFAFLTVGSLLIIVAVHLLSVEDAIIRLREIYASPWKSAQTGFIGLIFIMVGLAFTKMVVKKGREADAVIVQGEMGPLVVSATAIEDAVKKVMKKYHLVKEARLKTMINGKDVELRLRLTLWSGGQVPDLLTEVQQEVHQRIRKLLGPSNKLEVACDVHKIEDHEAEEESVAYDRTIKV